MNPTTRQECIADPFNLSIVGDPFRRARDQLVHRVFDTNMDHVAIWGAGQNGEMTIALLEDTPVRIVACYDRVKTGSVRGIPIEQEPSKLPRDTTVLITMNSPSRAINRIRSLCEQHAVPWIQVIDLPETQAELITRPRSLANYAGKHQGERCFVVGNGPSLNRIDMTKLSHEVTFGSNRCYLGFPEWGYAFSYWAAEDREVAGWQAEEWKRLRHVDKFLPQDMVYHLSSDDQKVCAIPYQRISFDRHQPLFSIYPEVLFHGGTVTYLLLQLAVIMGCSPIYLIGVDFHFETQGTRVAENRSIWRQHGPDINHFRSDYIAQGRYLHPPYLDKQQLAFQSAHHAAKAYGFRILNATPGTRLEVFPKVTFDELF